MQKLLPKHTASSDDPTNTIHLLSLASFTIF